MMKKSTFGHFFEEKMSLQVLKKDKKMWIFREKVIFLIIWSWLTLRFIYVCFPFFPNFSPFFPPLREFFRFFWPRRRGLARCGNIATAWAHPRNYEPNNQQLDGWSHIIIGILSYNSRVTILIGSFIAWAWLRPRNIKLKQLFLLNIWA